MLTTLGAVVAVLLLPRAGVCPVRPRATIPRAISSLRLGSRILQAHVEASQVPTDTDVDWLALVHATMAQGNVGRAIYLARTAAETLEDNVLVDEMVATIVTGALVNDTAELWQQRLALLSEMEDAGLAGQSAVAASVRVCRSRGEWARSAAILQRARERDVRCTVGMYSTAIAACDEAGEGAKAMELYALGVEDKIFSHWRKDEPFSIDLHLFSQPCAACAIRHVFQHELSNFLPSDLKIITGAGQHSEGGEPLLLPRIKLLLDEMGVSFVKQSSLSCDRDGCTVFENVGCIEIPVQDLFKWLVKSRPFETYYINLPASA